MAQLQLPIVPKRLYRYRSLTSRPASLEEEIEAIRRRYIFCSEFLRMNDPMEGLFESSTDLRADQIYREAIQLIRHSKLRTGLACFSETNEDDLLWAHYADNFSGICIEYSSADLLAGLPRNAAVVRMAYVDELPTISRDGARNADDAAIWILSQKKSKWAYEREWRVLAQRGEVSVGLTQPVTAIFFGLRTPNDRRQRILSRLQGTGIKAYMMGVKGYEHTFEPINAAARSRLKETAGKKSRKQRMPSSVEISHD